MPNLVWSTLSSKAVETMPSYCILRVHYNLIHKPNRWSLTFRVILPHRFYERSMSPFLKANIKQKSTVFGLLAIQSRVDQILSTMQMILVCRLWNNPSQYLGLAKFRLSANEILSWTQLKTVSYFQIPPCTLSLARNENKVRQEAGSWSPFVIRNFRGESMHSERRTLSAHSNTNKCKRVLAGSATYVHSASWVPGLWNSFSCPSVCKVCHV